MNSVRTTDAQYQWARTSLIKRNVWQNWMPTALNFFGDISWLPLSKRTLLFIETSQEHQILYWIATEWDRLPLCKKYFCFVCTRPRLRGFPVWVRLTNIGMLRQHSTDWKSSLPVWIFFLFSVSQAMLFQCNNSDFDPGYFKIAVKTVCRHDVMFNNFVLECERLPRTLFPRFLRFFLKCDWCINCCALL